MLLWLGFQDSLDELWGIQWLRHGGLGPSVCGAGMRGRESGKYGTHSVGCGMQDPVDEV